MKVDGRIIAEDLLTEVAKQTAVLSFVPKLGVLTCAPGFETRQYLELKKRKGKKAGIEVVVLELPDTATTEDCVACVHRLAEDCDGVLVQLPLPATIEREVVLAEIPVTKDSDGFAFGRDERAVLPPVVGAIDIIAKKYQVDFSNKRVVVVGNGRLVGQPAVEYARAKQATVTLLTAETENYDAHLKTADILISGVGKPHFITKDKVRSGVVVFDAGASEDGGVVVGDVHPEVAMVASLLTPVPGGIGPITIAVLFVNLLAGIIDR